MADAAIDDDTTQVAAAAPPPTPPDLSGLDPTTLNKMIQGLLGSQAQAAPPQQAAPSPHEGRGWLSLLGEALGGGESYGSTAEREQGGLGALAAMGARMLQASDYSYGHHTLGSIIGQGQEAAGQSLAGTQAVSAARQGAAQQYAQQQQENQLQRLKVALPLLQMQATMRAIGATPATIGGTGTAGNTSIASAGSADVPPDLLQIYQAASARTGIPVEVLIAQGKQESGFNSGATGSAGEIGIGQILPKTAASPGFGMAGISDPKALRDPATNINFQADYLKAHLPKGADPTDPAALAVALRGYNGGGDPDYVNHVMRFVPGARAAIAPPSASPAGAPGTPAPGPARTLAGRPIPPGSKLVDPGATEPPPTTAPPAPLPPPLPPPEPPAGGQAAGPAAQPGPIPPSPPGSDARLAALRAGMVGAGADPTTLAPGRSSPPAAQPGAVTGPYSPPTGPGAVVTASSPPAGPSVVAGPGGTPPIVQTGLQTQPPTAPDAQTPAPGAAPPLPFGQTQSQFIAANRTPPSPEQQAVWAREHQALLADAAGDQARAQQVFTLARAKSDAAGMAAAQKDLTDATSKLAAVRAGASGKEGEYYTTQDTNLANLYRDAQGRLIQAGIDTAKTAQEQENQRQVEATRIANARQDAETASKLKIAEINAQSDATAAGKSLEAINTSTDGAREVVNQSEMARQISQAAGTPGFLSQWPQLADGLVRAGLLSNDEVNKLGAQRGLEAVTSKLILSLKSQAGFSRFTNQDLTFLQNMAPGSFTPEQLRTPMLAAIQTAAQRQIQYGQMVNSLHANHMPVWEAQQKADQELGSIIPNTPAFDGIADPKAKLDAQGEWVTSKVPVGSFYMKPNGRLGIRGQPQPPAQGQQPQQGQQ